MGVRSHIDLAGHGITRETEEEGFEPPVPFGTAVFKTAALNHSATPPALVTYRNCVTQ